MRCKGSRKLFGLKRPETGGEGAAPGCPGRCAAGLGRGRRSARCQRGPGITGWPERRISINIAHYPRERSAFFIALSSGCNLLVLQFQWLKRQFRSSQFIVKGFFFSFLCVFLAGFLFQRKTADRMYTAKQS